MNRMSGFKALNIESDDESDVEVDDTKELQIEDALKLYQTALKYHAQSPAFFDRAAHAYQELFESEIFKYPESQSELQRIELYGPSVESDDVWDDVEVGAAVASASLDATPSTLPQILHLSHKNYAQFRLDYLSAQIQNLHVTLSDIVADASAALDHFVQALDKDDSDLDLWRRTAAVGEMVNSRRVARFCLEAVLDGDDDGINSVLSLPGLEESMAAEQLHLLVAELSDQLSLLQSSLSDGKRKALSKMLKQRLDTYGSIAARQKLLKEGRGDAQAQMLQPQRLILKAPTSWADLGDILLRQLLAEQHGTSSDVSSIAISFDVGQMLPPAVQAVEDLPVHLQRTAETAPRASRDRISPITIGEQFPGLDNGRPTVQPQIACAEESMQQVLHAHQEQEENTVESPTMTLPSRKRSGDTAGLPDANDEGRTTRKRIRTRESNADAGDSKQAILDANTRWEYEQQLNEFQAADAWTFETAADLFERIGVDTFQHAKDVRQELQTQAASGIDHLDAGSHGNFRRARADFYNFLLNYSDQTASVLAQSVEALELDQGAGLNGVGGFAVDTAGSMNVAKPVMPEERLPDFVNAINDGWYLTEDVARSWIDVMLSPDPDQTSSNAYTRYLWPEPLKTMVVRILVNSDEHIFKAGYDELQDRAQDLLHRKLPTSCIDKVAEGLQSIFELHLDVYTLIKAPNSCVEVETIAAQGERLQRWSDLAREAMHMRAVSHGSSDLHDELNLRFLWATTFTISGAADSRQDHRIECLHDLRAIFIAAGDPTIRLQNNAVMPELSVATLDREVSRLSTKDFFERVTSQDMGDPVAVIESLEPLLETIRRADGGNSPETDTMADVETVIMPSEIVRFLQSSDISMRLLLWNRLRDAYLAIEYKPMVVTCYFKMMRMLLEELKNDTLSRKVQSERQLAILRNLRLMQDMILKSLLILRSVDAALECVDEDGLKDALSMFGEILQLLQVFNVFQDSIRVGQSQPPRLPSGLPMASFAATGALLHDMQVHIWIILYMLLQEAIFQNNESYPLPVEARFDLLRCVHRGLGLRGICGGSNRVFVRLLKDEFVHMKHVEGYDSEQAQVLYDLYGLNCFLNPSYELIEHHCTHDAFLDRGAALQAADLLLLQASKIPMKELVKHSLKDTIDKIPGAVPKKKSSEAVLRNREIFRTFTQSPINPVDLFQCLKGEGNQLSTSPVPKDDASLPSKGWSFLMGHIALTKFRSQKRTAPSSIEDVDLAIAFFSHSLEYNVDHWETWFRLAQAYDTKIEENVVWSAEKLNNSMPEIIRQQRIAIHSYARATALAYRSADLAFETSEKLTELYTDFATRLYSSSREPFSMLPFALDDTDKFISVANGIGHGRPFTPLRVFTAWKLAKVLFQRALRGNQRSWYLHFMLGKCLWKMHSASDAIRLYDQAPPAQQVLDCFIRAIELLPDKKDSREKREPILEPHYKLVSIVHKMVSRRTISLEQAQAVLENTSYARALSFPKELDEWVPHVLAVLKNLRAADKSNWHHRMVARAAQIIYDDSDPRADGGPSGESLGAMGAKHELTQQMFTKTMVLQVWRPECERAGRHFVFTARYTRFFVKILEQLKDRGNLEQLARRVRRRPHDVFEHGLVWQDICNAYLRLLRSYAALPQGLETSTFSNIAHEDFLLRKEPFEKWMQAQDIGESKALDALRDVQEIKKINQSLMKLGPIDDLIGDAYAYLFNTIGKQLWEEERRAEREQEARRLPALAASPPRNPIMSLDRLMNLDGANDKSILNSAAPTAPPAPTPALQQSDPIQARKKIGVGRREIRTSAEACFQRAAASAAKASQLTNTRVQVVIETSKSGSYEEVSAANSAPGSIHDSADDESELSELEEDEGEGDDAAHPRRRERVHARRLMFPGLAGVSDSRGTPQGAESGDDDDVEMDHGHEKAAEGAAFRSSTSQVDKELWDECKRPRRDEMA